MIEISIPKRLALVIAVAAALAVPAVALAQTVFNDVPDTSAHIKGITFVKDSGVSLGCDTNNNYCPDDPVQRDQMATFLYRLSGNDPSTPPSVHAASADTATNADAATTAQDAAKLAGSGPLAYTTQIDGTACADGGGCATVAVNTETAVLELPVSIPADGVVAASYALSGTAGASGDFQAWMTLDDPDCGFALVPQTALPGSWQVTEFAAGAVTQHGLSGQSAFAATTGDHTLYLCAVVTGDPMMVFDGQITSIWSAAGAGSSLTGSFTVDPAVAEALAR